MTTTARLILDLAVDDFTGLWELHWRARESSQAPVPEATLRATLTDELTALVNRGLVQVYRGVNFAGDEVVLSPPDAIAVIAEEASWNPPLAGVAHARIAATKKGEAAYRNPKVE